MKLEISAIFLSYLAFVTSKSIDIKTFNENNQNEIDNDIIDFDDEYSIKYDKKHEVLPWSSSNFNKNAYRYEFEEDEDSHERNKSINVGEKSNTDTINETTVYPVADTTETTEQITTEISVIPIELLSTTESTLTLVETTSEPDLTVIPLSTTEKTLINIIINQTVTLPVSTEIPEDVNSTTVFYEMTTRLTTNEITTEAKIIPNESQLNYTYESVTENPDVKLLTVEDTTEAFIIVKNTTETALNSSNTEINATIKRNDEDSTEINRKVPLFTELDIEDTTEVPEDYYDTKDIVPTPAPKTDALSVIFGFAGSVVESVVESVAEKVVPKGLYDLFKRMQRQNEMLEAEKLRSREENGGIGTVNLAYIFIPFWCLDNSTPFKDPKLGRSA